MRVRLDTLICIVACIHSNSQNPSLTSAAPTGKKMLTSVSSGVLAKLSDWVFSTKVTAWCVFKAGVVAWATLTPFVLFLLRKT